MFVIVGYKIIYTLNEEIICRSICVEFIKRIQKEFWYYSHQRIIKV